MEESPPPLMRPFAALRAQPDAAHEVAAPPYDVMTETEARALAEAKKWSFVHVSRPEVDLPPGTDPHGPEAHAKAAETLAAMRDAGVMVRDPGPRYYIYRLSSDGHVQTGLVGAASVAAYEQNRIRKHELTRPDKEDDRVGHMMALGAQTGPVFAAHRPDAALKAAMERVTGDLPDVTVNADDGVEHRLWPVSDSRDLEAVDAAVNGLDALYIADGHHRSAAAARVAETRCAANVNHRGDESYNFFLAVTFPADEVRILDYNRVVSDLNGLTADEFLARLAPAFDVATSDAPVRPETRGSFGLYVDGRWHRMTLTGPPGDDAPALERLDISLLTGRVLTPILGIGDPRSDARIDFVGGVRGLEELERQVDSGEAAAAFALYPTALDDLMAVADAGDVMPPKSTWFEPKLADGLVCHMLD